MNKYLNLILLSIAFLGHNILSMQSDTALSSVLEEEMITFNIFQQIIKDHIDNNCNNLFTFEEEFNNLFLQFEKLRLSSKNFNNTYKNNKGLILSIIENAKEDKLKDLIKQCKAKYIHLDKNQLNKELFDALNSKNSNISNLEKATELFFAGADHNSFYVTNLLTIAQQSSNTLLMRLASHGKYQLVKMLVKNGANINLCNDVGYTALVHTIYAKDIKMIKLLIELGANINISDNLNQSPLVHAIRTKNAKIIELLLESKIDLSIRNIITGKTALDEAKSLKLQDIVELIKKYS